MPAKQPPRPAVPARPHRVAPPRPVPRVAPHALASLQRSAGNAAVTRAVQRLASAPASPKQDPRFRAVTAQVKQQGARLRAHPPAKAEAKKAQDAAVAPPDERDAKAKAGVADEMATAKPVGFDKAAFVAAVKRAIAEKSPKTLEDADNFAESGKAESVKAQVAGQVTEGKKASAKDIADKTAKPPNPAAVPPKPVTPLAPEKPVAVPRIETGRAMPARAPPEATDVSAPKAETDRTLAEAEVTESQLARSNEPEFTGALAAKKEGEQHNATAPAAVRASEAATLAGAQQAARATGLGGLVAMAQSRKAKVGQVAGGKNAAKERDEAKRAEIAAHIKGIFEATKKDVTAILAALDGEVARRFDAGEKAARDAFTADHKARMRRYKADRYSGWTGGARWAADLIGGLPDEANEIFVISRRLYESLMERVISDVADHIGAQLTRAKARIAAGQAEIKKYVADQPKDLQKVARQAAESFQAQFAQLESDVDSKQEALVEDLASRYVEARNAVDEQIKELQEANKGLWDKVKNAVVGVIKTILELKDMLLNVLARAAAAVTKIIKDPIGFLGNFVGAVRGGIENFAANIEEHAKKGLQEWLLGSLAEAGVEIPDTLDLKGIVQLVLSMLGVTWATIKARILKHVPERVMGTLEKSVDFIQVILGEGVGGLWRWVLEKVGDVKEMVMSQLRQFVVTRIVKAGISWLVSLLNPAAAFIKACKMIYEVVMFFVEKAAQIKEFVDSVLDSVEAIASGGVGAVADLIERTLAKMLPVLIGFLASLLNLGDVSDKVKGILTTIKKPILSVVDKLVAGAVRVGKRLLGRLTTKGAKQEGKLPPAVVKAKAKAALQGKRFASQADADTTLSAVFAELRPQGLKSLRLVPGKQGRKPVVLASASIAERIEVETDAARVFALALRMRTRVGTTSVFVTYDGHRGFGPRGRGAGPYTNRGAHAEEKIEKDAPKLLKRISNQRRSLSTPPGQPVPIVVDMNRLPCDHCAGRMADVFAAAISNREVTLSVRGASVWQQGRGAIPLTTTGGLGRLLDAGVDVQALHIWPIVVRRIRELCPQGELQVGNRVYSAMQWLDLHAHTFGTDAFDVDDLLSKVNQHGPLRPLIKY